MSDIQEILDDPHWEMTITFDPNEGGDESRIRFYGDPKSFRRMAEILTLMADAVDEPNDPRSELGWFLGFDPQDTKQLKLVNASMLTLNCSPPAVNLAACPTDTD